MQLIEVAFPIPCGLIRISPEGHQRKSAVLYACAKEQGFEVMEVNALECRNGAVVKQKIGEALESQWLKRLSRNQGDFHMKQARPIVENCKSESDGNLKQIELIRVSDGENSNEYRETAKGSLIMTSNNSNLVLPENLERHHIFFSMPSAKELLYHLHMICLAEKACIHHYLREKFVGSCGGDIQKDILHLPFWCQGTGCGRGK